MAIVSALLTMLSVVARLSPGGLVWALGKGVTALGWATRWERSHTRTGLKALRRFLIFSLRG
jgi:hypothetical protein